MSKAKQPLAERAQKKVRVTPARPHWRELGRRTVYASNWISMHRVDVELPDGQVARNLHLVDYHHEAAAVVAHDSMGRILLIRHYRFQTGTLGWEVPAGKIDEGETPRQAARREMREESGYDVGALKKLGRYHPSNGSSNQVFHVFAGAVTSDGRGIEDTNEVIATRWFSASQVRSLLRRNKVLDGLSLTALLWYLVNTESQG